jgi:enoyl-CoA hydratase/carnithine racemase
MRYAAGAAVNRLVLTAARLDPAEAHRIGLVDEVVTEDLVGVAVSQAARLSLTPAVVYERAKRQLREPAHARIAARRDVDDPGVTALWGDPGTQAHLRGFLASLASR